MNHVIMFQEVRSRNNSKKIRRVPTSYKELNTMSYTCFGVGGSCDDVINCK